MRRVRVRLKALQHKAIPIGFHSVSPIRPPRLNKTFRATPTSLVHLVTSRKLRNISIWYDVYTLVMRDYLKQYKEKNPFDAFFDVSLPLSLKTFRVAATSPVYHAASGSHENCVVN